MDFKGWLLIESEDFDTNTVWYHGTKYKKKIRNFKVTDDGVHELGKGIYFHRSPRTISFWARNGYYVKAYLRKGKYFKNSRKTRASLYADLAKEYIELHPEWASDPYAVEKNLRELTDRSGWDRNGGFNLILKHLGYLGVEDDAQETQVGGQIMVFDRKDIKIIGYENFDEEKHGYV